MAIYFYDGVPLLVGGDIAVHEDCCCDEGACYLLRECGSESNACNTCDPPIPDTLYVTPTGMGGTLAPYNGTVIKLTWVTGCEWSNTDVDGDLSFATSMTLYYGTGAWNLEMATLSDYIQWGTSTTAACNPIGTYSACSELVGTDGCGAGDAATATLALTNPTSSIVGVNEIAVNDDLSTYSYGDVILYNTICYYFIGVITCPATPITMGAWIRYSSCADCEAGGDNEQWRWCEDDTNAAVISPAGAPTQSYAWLCNESGTWERAYYHSDTADSPNVLSVLEPDNSPTACVGTWTLGGVDYTGAACSADYPDYVQISGFLYDTVSCCEFRLDSGGTEYWNGNFSLTPGIELQTWWPPSDPTFKSADRLLYYSSSYVADGRGSLSYVARALNRFGAKEYLAKQISNWQTKIYYEAAGDRLILVIAQQYNPTTTATPIWLGEKAFTGTGKITGTYTKIGECGTYGPASMTIVEGVWSITYPVV